MKIPKIPNEAKIGALAIVSAVLLYFGFRYLKGKSLFEKSNKVYAVYGNVDGLGVSNPVFINGLQIGTVSEIREMDRDISRVLVAITLNKEVNIPANSVASIQSSILGSTQVNIKRGDAGSFLKMGDTLVTAATGGMMDEVKKTLNPVLQKVDTALNSLTVILGNVNKVFDDKARTNIAATLANVNGITASLIESSNSLNTLLNTQTGAMAQTLNNVNSITANMARSNGQITNTLQNVEKTTANLAALNLQETLGKLQETVDQLKTTISKLNSTEGSIGMLMNDKKLYNNLESTTRSLNTLLDDFRLHPKRYFQFSVFGKKEKGQPLLQPVINDTLNKAAPRQ